MFSVLIVIAAALSLSSCCMPYLHTGGGCYGGHGGYNNHGNCNNGGYRPGYRDAAYWQQHRPALYPPGIPGHTAPPAYNQGQQNNNRRPQPQPRPNNGGGRNNNYRPAPQRTIR